MKWPGFLVRRPGEPRQDQAARGSKELREEADAAEARGPQSQEAGSEPGESSDSVPGGSGAASTSE
jgi:hypothetical protein